MTRVFHWQLLGVVALVAVTVAACGGGSDQPSPSPATTAATPATSTATATATATATSTATATASPPPTTTPTTAPSPRATATATPSPTPVPATATATPSPTPVAPIPTTPRATATATPTPTPTPATSTPAPTPTAPDATTFLYDTYDASGAVDTPGSYAFLTDASSTTSTANTHDDLLDAAAIVVNVSDRDGASQAALYNNIEVGDVVEWYPVGYEDCWLRYKITALLPEPPGDPPRKRFAVKWLPVAHLMCVDDVLADELDVELRWHPPAAHSDPHGGLPTMLMDQPVPGGASYYVAPFSPLAVDVPEEMTLVRYTGWAFGRGRYTVGLEDVATGSYLVLDINTGEELGRLIQSVEGDSRDVGALFNRIVASARTVVAAPTGTATPSQTPTPATATATPSPTPAAAAATTFRYGTYDTTGAVSTPGSYAFLSNPDDTSTVVTTYEALRDGTVTALLVHTSDADGASRADVYDAVEAGDLFEWHEADDCFVRYTVTEVKPDPTGTVPRKLLAVEWMTYAFTGCSGTISGDLAVTMDFGPLPDLGGTSLSAPVVHGGYQIAPAGWTGEVVPWGGDYSPTYPELTSTTDVAEARKMRHWREPALPAGWTFRAAAEGGYEIQPRDGYSALYVTADGEDGFELRGAYVGAVVSGAKEAAWHSGASLRETRVVAGRPAVVIYSKASHRFPLKLWVYDPATQVQYAIYGHHSSLRGGNGDAVIAIAESLFTPAPPATSATTFRYDTYDTTGAVSTAGSYAFLSDPDDPSTAVTTYEALRDGTTTALLIHKSDADGASLADVYDAVEAGDTFEWRQADDCFVRYTVTEIKPDPTGTVPRKLLAVEWLTYAFAGCSGAIETGGEHRIGWSPANITSPAVTSPIRHGNWLIVPQDWTGAMEEYVLVPYRENPECEGDEPTTLEEHAFGRRPALPDDWVVENIREMMCDLLHVTYRSADWTADIDVYISRQWAVPFHIPWVDPSNTHEVVEATMIDGHPAVLRYDSRGFFNLNMKIYHSSGIKYEVWTRSQSLVSNPQAVIDIARSLYDTPTPAPGATTTFRYDTYDTTGAVSTPGSHTILTDSSSTTSAASSKGFLIGAEAIIVTTYDSEGNSHAQFYDSIKVGDVVEWYPTNQPECWQRYKITAILTDPPGDPPRKRFAVESLYVFLDKCPVSTIADIVGQEDVELRWNPPAGRPGCDGIPVMLKDQPVPGGASYRAAPHENLVIDIPHGMTVVRLTGFVAASVQPLRLEDVESGSLLLMNLGTGEEWKRTIVTSEDDSRDVGALFDQIVASARTVVESCSD